jgi:hypothetical protein
VVNHYRYTPAGQLAASDESVDNDFHAHGDAGWIDDGNGLLYTGASYEFPELRLTLPAATNISPPRPADLPRLTGAAACFVQNVADCQFAAGRRDR